MMNVKTPLMAMIVTAALASCVQAQDTSASKSIRHKSEDITFFSKSLGIQTTCTVFTPDPMVEGKKYPVIYMLHGYSDNHRAWADRTSFTLAINSREMIAVLPDGGYSGWYVDSPIDPKNQYESLIVKDVIPQIDSRYPTVPTRAGRAISGLSMGGHGAVTLAAKHPDMFCSASSMSGVLNLEEFPTGYKVESLLGDRKENKELWRKNSAFGLADNFTSANVALMFDCGTADTRCILEARQLHEKLTNRGIVHTFNEYPGVHSWAYWGEHLPEHLCFHFNNMRDAMAGKPLNAGASVADMTLYNSRTLKFEQETEKWLADPKSTSPIILLGSSSFQGFKEKELMPGLPVVNRGISGDRIGLGTRGVSHRLYNTVKALKPRAVIINNGTNDIASTWRTNQPKVREISEEMSKVAGTLLRELPDTKVFLDTCHTTRDASAPSAPFIMQYNLQLKDVVKTLNAEYPGRIFFIDHASKVAGPDGLLDKQYAADGLHLNRKGQEIMRDCFMEALDKAGVLATLK